MILMEAWGPTWSRCTWVTEDVMVHPSGRRGRRTKCVPGDVGAQFSPRNELRPLVGSLDSPFLLDEERVMGWLPLIYLLALGSRTIQGVSSNVWRMGTAGTPDPPELVFPALRCELSGVSLPCCGAVCRWGGRGVKQ